MTKISNEYLLQTKRVIADTLTKLRTNKGISQSMLARKCLISRKEIYLIENAKVKISIDHITRYIFAVYNEELLTDKIIQEIVDVLIKTRNKLLK